MAWSWWSNARTWWGGLWNPDRGMQGNGPAMNGAASGASVTEERALQVSAAFSCIRLISELCASLPLTVYERQADGTRRAAPEHWLSALLDEPNPQMTGQEFREALVAGVASWGNGYAEKVLNSSGQAVELWPLRPNSTKVIRNGYDSITYRYSKTGGEAKTVDFTQAEVLHVKGFGIDGIMGLSPLGMAREAMGLAVASEDYASSFYRNGGKPSGVLMVEKPLTPDQTQRLEKKYGGLAQGGEQQGNKLWVLDSFAKYQSITIPPEDAQMLATRQFQLAEIARFFRVPLFLLMEMEKSTSWGTGLEQQNLAFLAYTLHPYLTRIEQAINRSLLSPAERKRYYVEHNVEGLLRADSKSRADFYSQMTTNGIYTRDECRQKENLPPKGGNAAVLTVQSALLPLDKLGENDPAPAGFSASGEADAT